MKKKECVKAIKPMLSEKRYRHSLNVAEEAKKLAKKFGADPDKAETAGLLHDILKDTPPEKQLKIITESGIMMSSVELSAKKFWHAIAGAVYIRTELGVADADILNAVRYHTTGRKYMSPLEKVIFVADFVSKDRDYPGVEQLRRIARKDIDKAIKEGIAFTLKDLVEHGDTIVPETIDAYNDAVQAVAARAHTHKKK